MRPNVFRLALAAATLLPGAAFAQSTFDSSGNSLLQGTYFVRHVRNANISSTGVIGKAQALTGTANFDGSGHYTFTGQLSDTNVSSGAPQSFTFSGAYAVSSSGVFEIANPLSSGDLIFGGVGKSAIVGSSTESLFFDFMVAVPMGSTVSNSSLTGTYRVVAMEYPNGDASKVTNSTFQITPNGSGSLGSVTVSGHAAGVNDNSFTQQISGATYSLSGTTGTFTFPASSGTQLVSGTKQFFVSSDGNILVGGAANGFDIEIGVKVSGSTANNSMSGVYFAGGLDSDSTSFADNGYYFQDAFYGSDNAVTSSGTTTILSHLRINPDDNYTYDFTYDDIFSLASDGTATETYYQYYVGASGTARVALGLSSIYSIEFDVQAQSLPVSGSVVINPLGVVNSANYLPVTNPVAPGEFLTLFGTGLGPATPVTSGLPFGSTLSGVSVSINGRPAPVYLASANQLICLVPFATSEPYAVIKVTNNGVTSNAVTLFTDVSSPGVFTQNQGGTGGAAAIHPNGSVVTASNPAAVGETIAVFLSGLGTVTPSVADGVGAPSTSLTKTDDLIDVFVDGEQANVTFSGLAPTFAGLYQVNFVVPSISDTGAVFLDIGDEQNGSYNTMALLYVSGKGSSASSAQLLRKSAKGLRGPATLKKSQKRPVAAAHKRGAAQ